MALLSVRDLSVTFSTPDGDVNAVNGVSFDLEAGDRLAIVGESGSGKSQTAFALMGLLAKNGRAGGSVNFDGEDLIGMAPKKLNRIRAERISMVFQDPMTSLNPYLKVSDQMAEVLTTHLGLSQKDAVAKAVDMLDAVQIPDAKSRIGRYPHEFSGGMRQRIMIAMSLLCKPQLLIADEPTTALDVTVQAQIMQLLDDLRAEFDMALILITHDLGVVAGASDRVMVLYGGQVMEAASTHDLFAKPTHPYTLGLLRAVPRIDRDDETLATIPGEPPDMSNLPAGCPFTPRCNFAMDHCGTVKPDLVTEGDHRRACHAEAAAVKAEAPA